MDDNIVLELKSKTDCNTQAISQLEKRVDEVEKKSEDIHSLATSVALMTQSLGTVNENIGELSGKMDSVNVKVDNIEVKVHEIESAPDKKKAALWDKAWVKIGSVIGAGILGYILSQLSPVIFGNG